jgi:hypothetical protein
LKSISYLGGQVCRLWLRLLLLERNGVRDLNQGGLRGK